MKKVIVTHEGIRYYVPVIFNEDDDESNYKGCWEPDEQYLHEHLNDDLALAVWRLAYTVANNKEVI